MEEGTLGGDWRAPLYQEAAAAPRVVVESTHLDKPITAAQILLTIELVRSIRHHPLYAPADAVAVGFVVGRTAPDEIGGGTPHMRAFACDVIWAQVTEEAWRVRNWGVGIRIVDELGIVAILLKH